MSYVVQKVLFTGQIFKMNTLVEFYILKLLESKNETFIGSSAQIYLSVCIRVFQFVFQIGKENFFSMTTKQNSRTLKFDFQCDDFYIDDTGIIYDDR